MRTFLLIGLVVILGLGACSKSEVTKPIEPIDFQNTTWECVETRVGYHTVIRTIHLDSFGITTGGTWRLAGNSFFMERMSVDYSGDWDGEKIIRGGTSVGAQFRMTRQ